MILLLIIACGEYLTHEKPCELVRDEDAQRGDYYADAAPVDWGICTGRNARQGVQARPDKNGAILLAEQADGPERRASQR